MVSKVCEQDKEITKLRQEITTLKAKLFAQYECYEAKLEAKREEIAAWIETNKSTCAGSVFMLDLLNAEQTDKYYAWKKAQKQANAAGPVAPPA